MSTITILKGDKPGAKRYHIVEGIHQKGAIQKPYLHDTWTVEINNLAELHELLTLVREDPYKYIIRAGEITMIKTEAVRSKQDGFLPIIAHRLNKGGYDFTYIADGQGSQVNLTNNKGQNAFADKDLVVEISVPHQSTVISIIDELGWDAGDGNAVTVLLMLDDLQQAIGRNSGYRWSDKSQGDRKRCIVLCEPKKLNSIVKLMRYHVDEVIDVPENRVTRKKDYENLVDGWCWYLVYLNTYLIGGIDKNRNAFLYDVKDLLNTLPDEKRFIVKRRLLTALNNKAKKLVHRVEHHQIVCLDK